MKKIISLALSALLLVLLLMAGPLSLSVLAAEDLTVQVDGWDTLLDEVEEFNSNAASDWTIVISAEAEIINASAPLNITNSTYTLTIASADHDVPVTAKKDIPEGALITVCQGATLILEHIIVDGDKDNTSNQNNTALVRVYDAGSFTLGEGAVLQNNRADCGGGVNSEGAVYLKGGKITGNEAEESGGGIFSTGEVTISSGVISGNEAISGGGIYSAGELIIEGGEISRNEAASGGGVYAEGTFTMTCGVISGNKSTNGSGFCLSNCTFLMEGGEIKDNTFDAEYGYGAINLQSTELTMTGGMISSNLETAINDSADGDIESTIVIDGGMVVAYGGFAVFSSSTCSTVTLSDGVAFAYNHGGSGIGDIIYMENSEDGFTGPTGAGVVVAWVGDSLSGPYFTVGDETDLYFDPPEATGCWDIVNGAGGISYSYEGTDGSNSGFIPVANATVSRKSFEVTFEPNGGAFTDTADAQRQVCDGDEVGELPEVTRSGYTLKGWFTEDDGGTQVNAGTTIDADVTFYAQWTLNSGSNPSPSIPEGPSTDPGAGTEPDEETVATVNGVEVELVEEEDGSVTLNLTAEDIEKLAPEDDVFVIVIKGQESININFPISAMGEFSAIKIETDAGTVVLSKELLEAFLELYGDDFGIFIGTGSLIVELMSEGKPVEWKEPTKPLAISLPVVIDTDKSADGYVAVKKEEGVNIVLPFSGLVDEKIAFKTPTTGVFDVIFNAKPFTDVDEHWALSNINYVSARDLFDGIGDDKFSPDTPMTRAMFAQVIANAEGADLSGFGAPRFGDVSADAWYAPAIEWAAACGVANGYGGGLFGPDDEITREQMAVMMINYVRYKGFALPSGSAAEFADEAGIASWALDSVKQVQAAGIVDGKPGNVYDPQGSATRAEVATIFSRFIKIVVG